MKLFNGTTNYQHVSPALSGLTGFTLAMMLRTTTAVSGATPAGWLDGSNHQIRLALNTPSAGRVGITLRAGTPLRISHWAAASIFDGQTHSVIFTRSAATGAIRAWIDGVEAAVTNTLATLTTQAINCTVQPCLGALDTSGTRSVFFPGAVGEFALFTSVLSDAAIRELAAGFAWRFHPASPPTVYYPGGGIELAVVPAGSIPVSASPPSDTTHPCIRAPIGLVSPACNAGRLGGYDVFAVEGRPAIVGVDQPVKRLPREVTAFTLPEESLAPDRRTFVSIVPFNLSGYADEASTFEVAVDDKGDVLLNPLPVTALRATARAGGWVDIAWTYVDPDGALLADEFIVAIEPLEGQAIDQPAAVPVIEPLQQDYATAVQLPDGAYRVRVYAAREGSYEPHVTGVEVRADGTAPAVLPVAMTLT